MCTDPRSEDYYKTLFQSINLLELKHLSYDPYLNHEFDSLYHCITAKEYLNRVKGLGDSLRQEFLDHVNELIFTSNLFDVKSVMMKAEDPLAPFNRTEYGDYNEQIVQDFYVDAAVTRKKLPFTWLRWMIVACLMFICVASLIAFIGYVSTPKFVLTENAAINSYLYLFPIFWGASYVVFMFVWVMIKNRIELPLIYKEMERFNRRRVEIRKLRRSCVENKNLLLLPQYSDIEKQEITRTIENTQSVLDTLVKEDEEAINRVKETGFVD